MDTKDLVMRIIFGQEGNLARVNSFGCANPVVMRTKTDNIVIFVSKFMWTLESMLILMGKNGFLVILARNGYTHNVRLKMVMKTWLSIRLHKKMLNSLIFVLVVETRETISHHQTLNLKIV